MAVAGSAPGLRKDNIREGREFRPDDVWFRQRGVKLDVEGGPRAARR
jgi:hypothetical protein